VVARAWHTAFRYVWPFSRPHVLEHIFLSFPDREWKRADIRIPWSDPDKFDPQAHPDLVCVLGASIKGLLRLPKKKEEDKNSLFGDLGMLQLAPVTESVKSFMQNLIRTYERAVDDSLEYKSTHLYIAGFGS